MNAIVHHNRRAADRPERVTIIVPGCARTCGSIAGCTNVCEDGQRVCSLHTTAALLRTATGGRASRLVTSEAETRQQRGERLIAELIGIGAKWLSENTSVMPGAWS